jgi:hypothetical protein
MTSPFVWMSEIVFSAQEYGADPGRGCKTDRISLAALIQGREVV